MGMGFLLGVMEMFWNWMVVMALCYVYVATIKKMNKRTEGTDRPTSQAIFSHSLWAVCRTGGWAGANLKENQKWWLRTCPFKARISQGAAPAPWIWPVAPSLLLSGETDAPPLLSLIRALFSVLGVLCLNHYKL